MKGQMCLLRQESGWTSPGVTIIWLLGPEGEDRSSGNCVEMDSGGERAGVSPTNGVDRVLRKGNQDAFVIPTLPRLNDDGPHLVIPDREATLTLKTGLGS